MIFDRIYLQYLIYKQYIYKNIYLKNLNLKTKKNFKLIKNMFFIYYNTAFLKAIKKNEMKFK